MTNALIQAVIDAADELVPAHDSTTGRFEPEIARLSAAVSALEKAMPSLAPSREACILDALRRIAAIPLWGEAIADPDLRAEYVRTGEYDAIDGFNPSSDTESSYLTDAVQTARAVLEALPLKRKEPS